jgi:predicted site-specific integrase-resolvase
MPSTNGHGHKRAILYARVSTDEQARSGYSLAQQLEALRGYAEREGYEVLEEVSDPGQSGTSLERPGMDRVRDLVAAGGVSVVLAQDRDRFAREPAYHYLYLAAVKVEAVVWDGVTKLLKDPEQLRADLDAMIEQERKDALRGDPDQEAKLWAGKLVEVERKRARYQDMAASELITFDELRARLLELDETRETAERELEIIGNHKERLAELEADRDALLASLMEIAPMALESLKPEERRRFYRMLGLRVIAYPDRELEVEFGDGLRVCERETAQGRCSGSGG